MLARMYLAMVFKLSVSGCVDVWWARRMLLVVPESIEPKKNLGSRQRCQWVSAMSLRVVEEGMDLHVQGGREISTTTSCAAALELEQPLRHQVYSRAASTGQSVH